jgi:hypothetical protein
MIEALVLGKSSSMLFRPACCLHAAEKAKHLLRVMITTLLVSVMGSIYVFYM